jgi:prolyl-tRNA synthetase
MYIVGDLIAFFIKIFDELRFYKGMNLFGCVVFCRTIFFYSSNIRIFALQIEKQKNINIMAVEIKELTSRSENYAQWYNDLVLKADLAENSAVRGCMVIKPYGYAIWEKIQRQLDDMFKETGHVNAYFPLFIPKSFLSKEADHVEGFAKECAVVTHYRLKNDPNGKGVIVDPDAKLEEELIVRPTSETIIWNTYKGWIQSYRDLPILVNQWANVVRWEMRTRLFLRTTEFLWQEGHTAHATKEEAIEETRKMLDVYAEFAEKYMAVPALKGVKTASERFAGALDTFCIEALMQDGKALQAGTSHFLGQNFAKAFDVQFLDKEGKRDYVWSTSWGVSTRLMGALIMAHSDDNGLVLPPKLAPYQVVIVPIYKNDEQFAAINEQLLKVIEDLKTLNITVKYDNSQNKKPGWKFAEYELKGVPVRLAMGGRDLENNTIEAARRDTLTKETVSLENIASYVKKLLDEIQRNIYQKALDFRTSQTFEVDTYDDFKEKIEEGGFILAHWDGTSETEELIKDETKATIRCIPFDGDKTPGKCMVTGKPSAQRVVFARAY